MGGLDIDYEMNSPQPLSKKVSEMSLNSVSFSFGAANFSLDQNENFGASSATASLCEFFSSPYSVELENDVVRTTSHLVHDLSNLNYDMFGNGSISDMANSFGQSQIDNIECSLSSCIPNKTGRGHLNLEPIEDFSDILKEDDKIPKVEHRICANFYSKEAEENSQNQAPKENYIHVRARRGQATNSHSLAERVRREKIGERMQFLQELVPGCSKITGKAMMLDEIINYVQSLQQQVEFLSMKLANVAPELNLPTEQIVIADILHSQGMDGVFAIDPRPTTSQTTPQAMFQFYGTMPRTHQ